MTAILPNQVMTKAILDLNKKTEFNQNSSP